MKPEQALAVDEINLSDLEFWSRPLEQREGAFKTLREERPVPFFDEPEMVTGSGFDMPRGPGYYALTRYADVVYASKHPDTFCSSQGATSIPDLPPVFLEFFGGMINMDDPKHARQRRIVSAAFSPRMLRKAEEDVQRAADDIVDRIIGRGGCDFVTEVASRLPLKIICDMMGIPESQYDFVLQRSNIILGAGDPEYVPEGTDIGAALLTAGSELAQLMQELAAERAQSPTDDLTSALVTANVDGEHLSHEELASFFILLVVAGNETTRNAISHGLIALTENPEQRQAWVEDFDGLAPTAVEEIVRWASPVIFMRRTATEPTEIGSQKLKEGDKVLLFYNSANRDEEVFDDPWTFDLRRQPNPHVGFGGPGPHFCLGAHLARREITVMYRELLRRVPDIRASGEPERLRSNFINGVKHLPCEFTPGPAA
ncbi:MAG TPA: cytochrome P450 [Acidimicrobiales bacterium]|nr:cytochrome P450 [Acidimicrobiales bacterium]